MRKHTTISKYLAYLLRHHPEAVNLSLDEHGWARVSELLEKISARYPLRLQELEDIVASDAKQRYSFNADHTLIRANQGHSVNVDVELQEKCPPDVLWHGSAQQYAQAIDEEGLKPCARLYVHLSLDPQTAWKVGRRHGKAVLIA